MLFILDSVSDKAPATISVQRILNQKYSRHTYQSVLFTAFTRHYDEPSLRTYETYTTIKQVPHKISLPHKNTTSTIDRPIH